tara:strand:+ start:45946 stop:46356 length:411 start_codon:yes stop_codon:yes gene_type:complete
MKRLKLFITVVGLGVGFMAMGQSTASCDKVYDYVPDMPDYNGSPNAIFGFIETELNPIITEAKANGRPISFTKLVLTINASNEVSNIEFIDFKGDEMAKKKLKAKIAAMKNWKSATKEGTPVCCKFFMPFQCVNMD